MSDTNVAERLKTFIESKGLSYSQFADTCGIPRPSLSQILTGRNKKISDLLVGQIHNMYPELSIMWLLFGEGQMEVWQNQDGDSKKRDTGGYLFRDEDLEGLNKNHSQDGQKIFFSSGKTEGAKNSREMGVNEYGNIPQVVDYKVEKLQAKIKELQGQIDNLKKNPRKVSHITVYYDDSTFETFFPR